MSPECLMEQYYDEKVRLIVNLLGTTDQSKSETSIAYIEEVKHRITIPKIEE